MKAKFEITEFDKQTLSALLETASYGNSSMFDYDLSQEASDVAEGEYYCDKAADALLKGKSILIYDNSCHEDGYSESDKLPFYGTAGTNWVRTFKHKLEYQAWNGETITCYVPGYEITLDTLIKGFNASNDSSRNDLMKNLLDEEFEGDMWDAYNIFQIAVYGEIIYG